MFRLDETVGARYGQTLYRIFGTMVISVCGLAIAFFVRKFNAIDTGNCCSLLHQRRRRKKKQQTFVKLCRHDVNRGERERERKREGDGENKYCHDK